MTRNPAVASEWAALQRHHPELVFVDALVVDQCGAPRGKRFTRSHAGHLFTHGMQIPQSVFLVDPCGEPLYPFGLGRDDGDPDGTAWPLAGTLTPVWGANPPRAQCLAALRNAEGRPCAADPRTALERVLSRFGELRLTPVVAVELEFYLLDGTDRPPRTPAHLTEAYGLEALDRHAGFLQDLHAAAELQGVPLLACSSEGAPGQLEANLLHQPDARRAADHAVLLRQVVRAAARAHGLDATFMAKPFLDREGSGLHVHLSLLDEAGRNVFDDGTREGSRLLRRALAGLQALMPESMALFVPNVSSYRRLRPGTFASVNRRWGLDDRRAGLRLPLADGPARRLEHRVAGADANPYYVLAAILAGVHHGLVQGREPDPPLPTGEVATPDPGLPGDLEAALGALAQARLLPEYLGGEALRVYGEARRLEAARLRHWISRREYEWYL